MHRVKNPNYLITTKKVLSGTQEAYLRMLLLRHIKIKKDVRDCLALLITLDCGLRATEMLNVTVGDFDFDLDSIFISSLKGSNQRQLPLKPWVSRQVKFLILDQNRAEKIHNVHPKTRVFDFGYQRLHQIWTVYRPEKTKTLHSLRHTFATRLYERCNNIKAVQIALGHRNINNTMVYVDFCYNQQMLRSFMYGDPKKKEPDFFNQAL